jgi:hypothetical protein
MVSLESHFAQPIQPPELPASEKAAKATLPVRPNPSEPPQPVPPVPANERDFSEPLPEQGRAQQEVSLFEPDNEVRGGAAVFESLAIRNDASGYLQKHFKDIYKQGKTHRAENIAKMAERLGVPQDKLEPMMTWLLDKNIVFGLASEIGNAEMFFRRLGFEGAQKAVKQFQDIHAGQNTRLSQNESTFLMRSLIRDIGAPGMIGQGGKGTCAAASLQALTANMHPQKYLDMTLALAEGKTFRLPDGKQLKPNDNWRLPGEDRQMSEAIVQNALMDLMLGAGKYKSHLDTGADQASPRVSQQSSAIDRLYGNQLDYTHKNVPMIWPLNRFAQNTSLEQIEDDLSRGRGLVVNIWGHAMALVGMDKSGPEPKVIIQTYGAQIEMPVSEFKPYLMNVVYVDDPGEDNRQLKSGERKHIGVDLARLP